MSVIKTFGKLLCASATALLLCASPLTTYAAPAPQKSTSSKKKESTKKTSAQQAASKKNNKKTTSSTKKDTRKKTASANTQKTGNKKKTAEKPTARKKNTPQAAPRTEPGTERQTMVTGEKPTSVQAATYSDSELERKKADDLLMSAMGLLGVSYRFGGSNPASGLDCSGFIQYIFRETMNVNLPRTSAAMAEVGIAVEKSELKPGDLVFFARGKRRIGHVGMYIGNGKFIHAPRTGKSIEIQDLNKDYYVRNYAGARRIPNANRATRFVQ